MAAATDSRLIVRKQLAVVVDGTASMAPCWPIIVDEIIKKIVRAFNVCDGSSSQDSPCTVIEFGVVMFTSHGPHSHCLVQASGWTRDVERFHEWLSGLSFAGGGHYECAVAEGLAETLVMFPRKAFGTVEEVFNVEQKHCILVAGSKPFSLPTPVFVPRIIKSPTGDYPSQDIETKLADAEDVAQLFSQCSVSLSVLSAKKFPKLKEVFIAANPDASEADISFRSEKYPAFLILLSRKFPEACAAIYGPEASNSSPDFMGSNVGTPLIHDDTEFDLDLPEEDFLFLQQIFCDPLDQKNTSAECNSGLIGMLAFPNHPHDSLPDFEAALPSTTFEEILGYSGTQNASMEMGPNTYQQEKVISCAANAGNTDQQGQVLSSPANAANTYQPGRETSSISNTRKCCEKNQRALNKRPRSENSIPSTATVSQSLDTAQNSSNSLLVPNIPGLSGNFHNLQMFGMGNLEAMETAIDGPLDSIFETSHSKGQTTLPGGKGPFHPQSSIIVQPKASLVNLQGSPNKTVCSFSSAASLASESIISPQLSACLQKDPGFDSYMQPRVNRLQLSGQNVQQAGFANQTISGGFLGQSSFSFSASTLNAAAEGLENTAREVNFTSMSSNHDKKQPQRNKYITAWEGNLAALTSGRFVLVTKLVSYRRTSTSEKITSDWPRTLHLGRLLCRKFFNNFLYHEQEEYLVFESKHIHPLFEQLRKRNFCVTVKLPSQTMIVCPTDKDGRFIGTIHPGVLPLLPPLILTPEQKRQQRQRLQEITSELENLISAGI